MDLLPIFVNKALLKHCYAIHLHVVNNRTLLLQTGRTTKLKVLSSLQRKFAKPWSNMYLFFLWKYFIDSQWKKQTNIYVHTQKKLYSEIRSSSYIHSVGVNMRVGKDFRKKSTVICICVDGTVSCLISICYSTVSQENALGVNQTESGRHKAHWLLIMLLVKEEKKLKECFSLIISSCKWIVWDIIK